MGCLFLYSILALSISSLYSCASIEEQIYSLKRDQAITELQKGTITGDLYKNDYYRCQMSFGPEFRPELDFPKDLLVLLHKDGVTEVRLTSNVYPEGDFDSQAAIGEYSKRPTYRIVSQGPVTINRLRGIKAIFMHRLNEKPEGALMTSHVYFFAWKNMRYMISVSTPANYYESVALECNNVIDSFRVIQPMEAGHSLQLEKATIHTSKISTKSEAKPTAGEAPWTSNRPQREEFSGPYVVHEIQSGETLAIIAERYTGKGENWRRIAKFNRIADPRRLQIGQAIKIPGSLCIASLRSQKQGITKPNPKEEIEQVVQKEQVPSAKKEADESIKPQRAPTPKPAEEILDKEALAFEKRNVDEKIESLEEPVVTEPVKKPTGVVGKDAVSDEIGGKEQLKTVQEAIAEPKPEEVSEEVVERKEVASAENKVDETIKPLKEPIPEPVTGPPGVQEINELSKALAEKIAASGEKTIAVVDFADLQGNVTELGRFLAEEISAELVNAGKGFEVVDRLHLKAILKEHKLSASGLIDPTTARELGKVAGVAVLVTGTVTPFGERVKISAKAMSTQSAKVICSSRGSIPKTQAIEDLLAMEVETAGTVEK